MATDTPTNGTIIPTTQDDWKQKEGPTSSQLARALDLALVEADDFRHRNETAALICVLLTLFSVGASVVFAIRTFNASYHDLLGAYSYFSLLACVISAIIATCGVLPRRAEGWPMSWRIQSQSARFLEAATNPAEALEKQVAISLALQSALRSRKRQMMISLVLLVLCALFMFLAQAK